MPSPTSWPSSSLPRCLRPNFGCRSSPAIWLSSPPWPLQMENISCSEKRFGPSVTRLAKHFPSKVALIFWSLCGYFEKHDLKNAVAACWATFVNICATFNSNILSHFWSRRLVWYKNACPSVVSCILGSFFYQMDHSRHFFRSFLTILDNKKL